MKLADLDLEVRAGAVDAMAGWRRCLDPAGCERDNANNETVIRLRAAGRYVPAPAGVCDYCRGRRP